MSQFAIQIPPASLTQASALDNNGNTYVSAVFGSSIPFDYDRSEGELLLELLSTPYIASYDQAGSLRYAFILEDLSPNQFGTSNTLTGQSMLVDNDGNIFLIGVMSGWIDFNPGTEVNDLQTLNFGENHGFIVSYDTNGNFRFLHDLGRTNNQKIFADVSPEGDVTLTYSLIGEATIDNTTIGEPNTTYYYLVNFNSSGNLGWVYTILTEPRFQVNTAARLKVDDMGNIYLMNVLFRDIDLDPGSGVVNLGVDTLNDSSYYIASYSSDGDFRYAHRLSESFLVSFSHIYDFEVDNQENVYLYGPFFGTVNFEAQGDFELTSAVTSDMFLVSYNSSGLVRYGQSLGFLGTSSWDGSEARPLHSDILPDGRLLLSGWFTGDKDFDPSSNELRIERNGNFQHTFLNVYDTNNGEINEAFGFLTKGNSGTLPWGINTNEQGEILVNGFFADTVDFNPTGGEALLVAQESGNYLTLLDADFSLTTSTDSRNVKKQGDMLVFPNPTSGKIYVLLPERMNGVFRLVSPTGQVVFENGFDSVDGSYIYQLPDNINNGTFYFQVITDKGLWATTLQVVR